MFSQPTANVATDAADIARKVQKMIFRSDRPRWISGPALSAPIALTPPTMALRMPGHGPSSPADR